MSWMCRGWFGARWFGQWFGVDVVVAPWSGKITVEVGVSMSAVDVEIAARYAQGITLETADCTVHLRA